MPNATRPRVVILGAGFAGLTAARSLRHRLGRQAQICLIDQHNYHLFTPLLYQVAALQISPYDAAIPLRPLTARAGIRFRLGTVTGVDFAKNCVHLADGQVGYDHLVIALGSTTNFFHNQAAQDHALPLKWLEDGVAIRNQVADALERAALCRDADERKAWLTFVVVGGGATGVETAAALASLLRRVVPADYPAIRRDETRVVIVQSPDALLSHMGDDLGRRARDGLHALGVEVWLNTKAKDVTPTKVTTDNGRTLPARTVIWATGVRAPDLVAGLDAPHAKAGSLAVDSCLQVCDRPGVYAVGDNAHVDDGGKGVPLLAASAVQEGRAVAANIARAIAGQPPQPFAYHSLGSVVALGHGRGLFKAGPLVVGGLPGWLAWRMVHLSKITAFRNQLATLVDWSVSYVSDWDTARLAIEPAHPNAQEAANA